MMTCIFSLPEEIMLEIFSYLPLSALVSVWRSCRQWRDLSSSQLAAWIQASWVEGDQWAGDGTPLPQYYPSDAALAATGHLTSVECMKQESQRQSGRDSQGRGGAQQCDRRPWPPGYQPPPHGAADR